VLYHNNHIYTSQKYLSLTPKRITILELRIGTIGTSPNRYKNDDDDTTFFGFGSGIPIFTDCTDKNTFGSGSGIPITDLHGIKTFFGSGSGIPIFNDFVI